MPNLWYVLSLLSCHSQARSRFFRGEQNILRSLSPDFFIQLRIFQHRFHVHIFSALFHTENLSGAAQFGSFSAILKPSVVTLPSFEGVRFPCPEKGVPALKAAAPDTTAKLMQLCQSEPLGVFDDDLRSSSEH